MAQEILVVLSVVIPDEPPESRAPIRDLRGRELPGVPGSWVTRVAIHSYPHPPRVLGLPLEAEPDPGAMGAGRLTAEEREHELDLDFGAGADEG